MIQRAEQRGLLTPIKAAATDQTYISSGGSLRHRSQREPPWAPVSRTRWPGLRNSAAAPGCSLVFPSRTTGRSSFPLQSSAGQVFFNDPRAVAQGDLGPGPAFDGGREWHGRGGRSRRTGLIRPQRSAMSAPGILGSAKERDSTGARKGSRQKHHGPKTRRSLRRKLTGRRANRGARILASISLGSRLRLE